MNWVHLFRWWMDAKYSDLFDSIMRLMMFPTRPRIERIDERIPQIIHLKRQKVSYKYVVIQYYFVKDWIQLVNMALTFLFWILSIFRCKHRIKTKSLLPCVLKNFFYLFELNKKNWEIFCETLPNILNVNKIESQTVIWLWHVHKIVTNLNWIDATALQVKEGHFLKS